jgi:hypothetical protein
MQILRKVNAPVEGSSSYRLIGQRQEEEIDVFDKSLIGGLASSNGNLALGLDPSFKGPVPPNPVRLLVSTIGDPLLFYLDSGAGQCLCSHDSSFVDLTPCMVEITGIAGALQIYGCGTAMFLAQDVSGRSFALRVHNCLFGGGQFNLLSVSQLSQKAGNSVNLSLDAPTMTLRTSGSKNRAVHFPLFLDEGLFGFHVEPLAVDDPRFLSLPKIDVKKRLKRKLLPIVPHP